MGNTIKTLAEKKLKAESDIYSDFLSLEICENFHIHLRNLRMMFNEEEFKNFHSAINCAYNQWSYLGKPHSHIDKENQAKIPPIYLCTGKLNPIHGERPNDFAIEVQGDLPHMPKNMIHIHYKSLRLDVSHKEFLELADLFIKSKEEFLKWQKSQS